MGGYYLCEAKRARHPYYIESVGIHIWSVEELCYYMKENVYLLDETILNEELCDWLEDETRLARLASVLRQALERGAAASEFVLPIFQECGYLSEPQYQYFQEELAQVQIEPRDIRKKMKADYLVNYGMYVRAIEEYEGILRKQAPGRMGIQFYAAVWENMAAAYARLFRFEEAADCLWHSYSILKSRKVYERYLRVLPLYMSEESYRSRLAEIKADRDVAAAMKAETAALLAEAQESHFAAEWDGRSPGEQLAHLEQEYIRCTKN